MATKPRRRRHNKQSPSYGTLKKKDGTTEQIPLNRKAFRQDERLLRQMKSHDMGVIRKAIYGIESHQGVLIRKEQLHNKKLAGYYDSKGRKIPKPENESDAGRLFQKALSKFKKVIGGKR